MIVVWRMTRYELDVVTVLDRDECAEPDREFCWEPWLLDNVSLWTRSFRPEHTNLTVYNEVHV